MKSIVVGGGKIGYNLVRTLKMRGYEPTLIEIKESICKKVAQELDADVIYGDGSNPQVLKEAGIYDAEVIAAVTGKDEENLVICEIAKELFSIEKTIARVNNPKNLAMFRALGVGRTVCSTEVIANLVEYEFDREVCKVVQTFERGEMMLIEVRVNKKNPWLKKQIKDIQFPQECVVASVLRDGKIIYPRGDTAILEDDSVLLITNNHTHMEIKKLLR